MRVVVAGGTGLVGRLVVAAVQRAGHEALALSRGSGVDLVTGAGVHGALASDDVVIDVSNTTTMRRAAATAFFEAATRTLLDAGRRAGVRHHVALSIVGVDRVGLGYYQGKVRQERLLLAADAPVSVLRATQFHEFVGQALARFGGPVVPLPRMRTQPVAAREVADALVELALGEPCGMAPELAGPQTLELAPLARKLLRARGAKRAVVSFRMPGAAGRAMAAGALLPTGDGPRGRQTFDEWLSAGG